MLVRTVPKLQNAMVCGSVGVRPAIQAFHYLFRC